MKSGMFFSALFKLKNLGILLISLGLASQFADPSALPSLLGFSVPSGIGAIGYPAAALIYLGFVAQTLLSKEFHEDYRHKEKAKNIRALNFKSIKLSSEAKRYTNAVYSQKLRKVLEDKNDIVNAFFRGERSYLKDKIVEQSLNLVVAYVKLMTNFCIRSRELSEMDVGDVVNRINANLRKLSFIKDPQAADDVKMVIEMDEKIVGRLKEEKQELERISAKLDYMESTVNMFKHQVISSIESEDMLEKLETAVNEATALDNVLEQRRSSKVRI